MKIAASILTRSAGVPACCIASFQTCRALDCTTRPERLSARRFGNRRHSSFGKLRYIVAETRGGFDALAFVNRRTRNQAFTLIELLVVVTIIVLLAALLLPVLSRAKARARNATCISQLRQLGIATRLYAEDNGSRLPAAERLPSLPLYPDKRLPRICDVLASYVGKTVGTNAGAPIFKCPCDLEEYYEVEGSSYMWNARLNSQRIDFDESVHVFGGGGTTNGITWSINTNLVHSPETTPLFSDYDDFHPRPSASGKNVVFMDGHVALPQMVSAK